MLTPNLMPGSVCIREDGTPTALNPAVSLETWMEFYWKVRAFNVTGSGSFTDDNFQSYTDTFNGVQGDSIQGVTMRSFMCQLLFPGLPNIPPNPLIQSGVFGSYVGPPENPEGNFFATLTPLLGFKKNGNYYISLAFSIDVVATGMENPAGQITFILESGSFVIPLGHNFEFGSASYNLFARPASLNIPD
jgi:hypothetical protein